jgi:amino acid transporter
MTVIILTAVLSCMNSAFYVSSRVLFVLAERGDAPELLVKLNARKVPVASVLMGAFAGFLGIIAATGGRQKVFDFLVSSSGAVIVFIYMAISISQIVLRKRRERNGEPAPSVNMWLFPWLSYAAIAAMAAVLIAMAFTPGLQQDFYFSCITSGRGNRRVLSDQVVAPTGGGFQRPSLSASRQKPAGVGTRPKSQDPPVNFFALAHAAGPDPYKPPGNDSATYVSILINKIFFLYLISIISSTYKNYTTSYKEYAAVRIIFGSMSHALRWPRKAASLGESRAGKPANSPAGAISRRRRPSKGDAVFYSRPRKPRLSAHHGCPLP